MAINTNQTKILMDNSRFSVMKPDGSFVEVAGLNSLSPSISQGSIDVATFEDGRWGSFLPGSLSGTASYSGLSVYDKVTGVQDEGQVIMTGGLFNASLTSALTFKWEVYLDASKTILVKTLLFPGVVESNDLGGDKGAGETFSGNITIAGQPILTQGTTVQGSLTLGAVSSTSISATYGIVSGTDSIMGSEVTIALASAPTTIVETIPCAPANSDAVGVVEFGLVTPLTPATEYVINLTTDVVLPAAQTDKVLATLTQGTSVTRGTLSANNKSK